MIVITGSSGFIGSNLKEAIPEAVGIDKHLSKWTDIVADISIPDFIPNLKDVDVLYHLAASPLSMFNGDWFENSEEAFRNNVVGTYNVLRVLKPKRVIFTSTANVYGRGRNFAELLSPIRISSPYGYSKWLAEETIRSSGIPYTIYRLGTVTGRRGRTFPNRLAWCAVNDSPVELFCRGEAYRDLVDVRDVIDVLVKAPEILERNVFDTYNLSLGSEVKIGKLAECVKVKAKERGYIFHYTIGNECPKGYVQESTLSTTRINKMVGWKPHYNIKEIIDGLLDYYEETGSVEPPQWVNS